MPCYNQEVVEVYIPHSTFADGLGEKGVGGECKCFPCCLASGGSFLSKSFVLLRWPIPGPLARVKGLFFGTFVGISRLLAFSSSCLGYMRQKRIHTKKIILY